MSRASVLTTAFLASLLVHAALLVAVPGRRTLLPVVVERLFEVEVLAPEPIALPEPPLPPEDLESQPSPSPRPLARDEAAAVSEILQRAALPPPPPPAAPPVRLPARNYALPEVDDLEWELPKPPGPEPLPQAITPRPEAPPAPRVSAASDLARSLLEDLSASPPPGPSVPQGLPRIDIEGPVGVERKVTREPPPPQVPIRNPVDVRIKFWVSPRGEVIRAVPTQRGDPALDSAALAYIKSFRFNALPPGDEKEQWGTIRVKFRLE